MNLNSTQLNTLKTQIQTDPNSIGYASAAGNVQTIANLGNAVSSTLTVARPSIDRDALELALLPAVEALPSASSAIQSKYANLFALVRSSSVIALQANVVAAMNTMVTDGLWTQADADAVINQPASDFETVLGAGVAPSHVDVAAALYGASR